MHSLRPTLKPLTFLFATTLSALANPAHADTLQEVQAQVEALLKKTAELEQKQKPAANAVTAGSSKGSFKLPGSNTSVTLGGYVKLDAIYSDKSAGVASTADQQYEAGAVPVGSAAGFNERGQLKLHARQSRVFAKTSKPSDWGDLTSYVEFDLFGASGNESVSNSHGLRMRHAYGTLGGFLAGQTWTTFADVAAYPETVDFGGPAGQIFARQAQVRWTQQFGPGQWSIALENPETVATLPSGATFRADDDRFPDIAANIKFDTMWGKYSFAALARQLRMDSATDPSSRDQKWGGGVGVNAVIPTFGRDDARVSIYYGNALGRYTAGFFTDALIDSNARLVLPNEWVFAAAYRHYWSESLRSTLALSGLRSSNPSGVAGSANKSADSAHLNLIWSPLVQTNFGLEYIYAKRVIENGQSGKLNRLQAAAQYIF
ncbi:MAG: DcaP family trimeric outer membrane transporter [Burkholderiaceae bacterium]